MVIIKKGDSAWIVNDSALRLMVTKNSICLVIGQGAVTLLEPPFTGNGDAELVQKFCRGVFDEMCRRIAGGAACIEMDVYAEQLANTLRKKNGGE